MTVDIESGPQANRLALVAGPMAATFIDGDLFDVRWQGVEVLQRLYVAVRDENWNTIPGSLSNLVTVVDGQVASIEFEMLHDHDAIAYVWHGSIRADASGVLTCEMRGRALRDFSYCKIGFNLHHGLDSHTGRSFRVRGLDGLHDGVFRAEIEPQLIHGGTLTAMTPHFDRLEIDLEDVGVVMQFEGDRFEMQDHRNWVDANWKTYGTPLEYGFPMGMSAGGELLQRIVVTMSGGHPAAEESALVELDWGSGEPGALPRIGHLLASIPSAEQVEVLRSVAPDHLRVDLHPGDDLVSALDEGQRVAQGLNCHLEVGAFLRPEHAGADANALAEVLAACVVPIDRILVLAEVSGFSAFRGACPPEVSDLLRARLSAWNVQVPRLVSGTSQFFVDINRDRPDYTRLDGIVCALNPQVHACDDRSLMQNVQAIAPVVEFARVLYPDADVVFSPVELIGASGPFPAGPGPQGGRPANEDPRQSTAYCAAWTVAALAQMVRSRVTSATYFDLTGPRGLLVDVAQPFGVMRMLQELRRAAGHPLVAVTSSDPEQVAAMAFGVESERTIVLANLTDRQITVRLPWGSSADVSAYDVMWSSERDGQE